MTLRIDQFVTMELLDKKNLLSCIRGESCELIDLGNEKLEVSRSFFLRFDYFFEKHGFA